MKTVHLSGSTPDDFRCGDEVFAAISALDQEGPRIYSHTVMIPKRIGGEWCEFQTASKDVDLFLAAIGRDGRKWLWTFLSYEVQPGEQMILTADRVRNNRPVRWKGILVAAGRDEKLGEVYVLSPVN